MIHLHEAIVGVKNRPQQIGKKLPLSKLKPGDIIYIGFFNSSVSTTRELVGKVVETKMLTNNGNSNFIINYYVQDGDGWGRVLNNLSIAVDPNDNSWKKEHVLVKHVLAGLDLVVSTDKESYEEEKYNIIH